MKKKVGEIETPEFQGTHLWERLCWAKDNLERFETDYRVVYEDPNVPDEPAKILHPTPEWMACALQGGILPPVSSYWELKKDEQTPGFRQHTRGPELLHNMKPIDAMTEEEAIEYIIMKDIPEHIWRDWNKGNKPRLVICRKEQLPQKREWRNAWKIKEDINTLQEKVAQEIEMTTTNIVDKDGKSISKDDVSSMPSDRHFRGAWTLSGRVISEDMTIAKAIFKDKIREVRKELLEAEDVVYMKALEADDASAKTASIAKKKKLRDAPAASAITNADTIAKLKAAWDTDVLGDSPYEQDKTWVL